MSNFGFDFRSSTGFVTDPSTCTFVTEADAYPTTRTINGQSVTFGWVAVPTGQSRDRNSGIDARLAGAFFSGLGAGVPIISFRVDLPVSGGWSLNLAAGDASNDRDNQIVVKDNTTTLATISGSTVGPGSNFVDAGGNLRSSAAWPGSNASLSLTFASTSCFINSNTNGGSSNTGSLAHVFLTQSAATPTLTAAGTGNAFTATATGVSITGTNLGANTAARTLSLIQGSTTVAQTQQSGNATSGTFDVVFDAGATDIKYGAATLRATVSAVNADLSVTVTAPTGKSYVDLTTPNATAGNRITAVADLVSGDQLEASNVQGGLITDVNVNADATFDCASAVTAFDVRAWSTADSTWGAIGTQTITGPVGAGFVPNGTENAFGIVVTLGSFGLKTDGTLRRVI